MSTAIGAVGGWGLHVDDQMRRHRLRMMIAITVGYSVVSIVLAASLWNTRVRD